MPSKSKAEQHFMGMELAKKRAGKKTKTGMSEKQLKEFAATKTKGLPEHVKPKSKKKKGKNKKLPKGLHDPS